MTIDSFAIQVLSRWQTLAKSLGIEASNFDQICDACGRLLEHNAVACWVVRSYPIILVDEAQELTRPRLRIISALAGRGKVLVAADEFQCLDETADTRPFMEWFNQGDITRLTHIHRTRISGLLAAGANLRGLASPQQGLGFQIEYAFRNVAPFKIGASIHRVSGTKVILYPPGGRSWAEALTSRLAQGLHSQQYNIPPIHLIAEPRTQEEVDMALDRIGNNIDELSFEDALSRLSMIESPPKWIERVRKSLITAANCLGKISWTFPELKVLMERTANNFRAYSIERSRGVLLLPIHQAKNRQFDHVVIIWPPGVRGSDDLKARLLYNGITRARQSCKVFVRTQNLLAEAPFRFSATEVAETAERAL